MFRLIRDQGAWMEFEWKKKYQPHGCRNSIPSELKPALSPNPALAKRSELQLEECWTFWVQFCAAILWDFLSSVAMGNGTYFRWSYDLKVYKQAFIWYDIRMGTGKLYRKESVVDELEMVSCSWGSWMKDVSGKQCTKKKASVGFRRETGADAFGIKKWHQLLFQSTTTFPHVLSPSRHSPSTVQTKGACLFPLHDYEKIKPLHAKMARWLSDREKEKLPGMRNNAISHP